jgi:hypothetical protein
MPDNLSRPQTPETAKEDCRMMTPQGNHGRVLTLVQITQDKLQTLLQQLYHPPVPSNLKVEDLILYYGERPKLRAFLMQCKLEFNCKPNKFNQDTKKVNYASLQYQGNAWAWIEPSITDGKNKYEGWEDFKTTITQAFGEVDSKEVARRKFKTIQ